MVYLNKKVDYLLCKFTIKPVGDDKPKGDDFSRLSGVLSLSRISRSLHGGTDVPVVFL